MNSFTSGLVAGAIVGVSMSMMINPMDSRDVKRMRKNTGRFFSHVGNLLDSVLDT